MTTTPPEPGEPRSGERPALPVFALPSARFFGASVAGGAVPAAAGAVFGAVARPDIVQACWLAGIAAVGGSVIGGLAVRPWKARSLALWPAGLLLGQLASFAGVTVCGLLLYSAARPKAVLAFGLVAAAGFLLATIAQVAVYDRRQKASPPTAR